MASIRSSINLIDNMSRVLDNITGKNNRMKQSIEQSQKVMNQRTEFANNLSHAEQKIELLGQKYTNQARIVENLNKQYKRSIELRGMDAEKTLQIKQNLINAQLAQMKYAEQLEKTGDKLKAQEEAAKNFGGHIDGAAREQRRFNQELDEGSRAADSLLGKIKGFVGAYLGFRGMKRGLKATIGEAAQLNQQVAVMQAAFGNADVGKHYFHKLQLYAIETNHSMEDLFETTKNFMQLTRNTDKLMGLTDIANKLSLRAGSLNTAESMIQEAIAGRANRLQRALHLTDAQMKPLEQAVKQGSLDGIIGAFNEVLSTAGLTDEIVEAYQNTPLNKFEDVIERIKLKAAQAGEDALMQLEPALDKINSWLQSERADQFFGAISAGVSMLVNGVIWLTEVIMDNWDIIQPILIAIATVYLVNIISQLWAAIPPILAQAAAWIAAHWPILLVAAAVLLFIKILLEAGVTAGQITGFIAGAFAALGATIYNVVAFCWNVIAAFIDFFSTISYNAIAFVWNIVAAFAEFFANVFNHPAYAWQKLIYDLMMAFFQFSLNASMAIESFVNAFVSGFLKGVNQVIGGINWLINALNKLPGFNIGKLGTFATDINFSGMSRHFEGAIANMKPPEKPADAWEAPRMEYKQLGQAPRMDYKSIPGAAKKGYQWGYELPDRFSSGLDSIEDAIKNFAGEEAKWNAGQNDNLGSLGPIKNAGQKTKDNTDKIKKSVDKSQEDLKWLRDIAEQEVINRFTTATLAPQISIEFGDVRETADVDGIVDHIENILQEQLDIAAEGVHV